MIIRTITNLSIIAVALMFLVALPGTSGAIGDVYTFPDLHPCPIVLSPDNTTIYAMVVGGFAAIDKATMTVQDTFTCPAGLRSFVLSPDGQYIYGAGIEGPSGNGRVVRINVLNGQTDIIDVSPANAYKIAIDDIGAYLYVSGGIWPDIYEEGFSSWEVPQHPDTGRLFKIRTSDFTLVSTLNIGVHLHMGIAYQDGKVLIYSREAAYRPMVNSDDLRQGVTCYIINADDLTIAYEIPVGPGLRNAFFALPGDVYVMGGFINDLGDGVSMGLINVQTGEVEEWFVTNPDPGDFEARITAGAYNMTIDPVENMLYTTFYSFKDKGQGYTKLGIVNLNTNTYSDWLVTPYRKYVDIEFDTVTRNLYLTVPSEDAIVILEPPE